MFTLFGEGYCDGSGSYGDAIQRSSDWSRSGEILVKGVRVWEEFIMTQPVHTSCDGPNGQDHNKQHYHLRKLNNLRTSEENISLSYKLGFDISLSICILLIIIACIFIVFQGTQG